MTLINIYNSCRTFIEHLQLQHLSPHCYEFCFRVDFPCNVIFSRLLHWYHLHLMRDRCLVSQLTVSFSSCPPGCASLSQSLFIYPSGHPRSEFGPHQLPIKQDFRLHSLCPWQVVLLSLSWDDRKHPVTILRQVWLSFITFLSKLVWWISPWGFV